MEQTNSWGRKIKDVISVTFKKDELDIKAFLNEQPSPTDYIKMLVIKDMKNIDFSIPPQAPAQASSELYDNEEKAVKEENESDIIDNLSEDARKKMMAIMDDDE